MSNQKIDKIEDYLCTALSLIEDFKIYYDYGTSELYIIERIETQINNAMDTLLYEEDEEAGN